MSSKKVLIVDDSSSMRQVVSIALKKEGYHVVTAQDGKDGVSKVNLDKFDIIVSDLNMPNMNGIEFIKAVKQNANNKFVPIIMLTTESATDLKEQGRQAGAKAWLVKPFKAEQLVGAIKKIVG